MLIKKKDKLYGILNGIDYEEWNPEKDKDIFKNYSIKDFREGKRINKEKLLEEVSFKNLDSILIGMVARLTYQKGIELLIESFDEFFKRNLKFILLATGEEKYIGIIKDYEKKYEEKFKFFPDFNLKLSKKIYAGCDLFLIPSKFEPCGLTQMISARYGTPVLAYKTGGLKDTVEDYEKEGWGFLFEEYKSESFIKKIDKVLKVYENKKEWENLIIKAMEKDFSWNNSAREYIKLYNKML